MSHFLEYIYIYLDFFHSSSLLYETDLNRSMCCTDKGKAYNYTRYNYTDKDKARYDKIQYDTAQYLGIYLTSDLSWTRQIHETCLRANRKLAVLRRVKYLKRHTLDLLYKITVSSIIDYGLVLYYYNCTVKDKAKYAKMQYDSARLVSSTLKYQSKEEEKILNSAGKQ